jgi:cytochrome bd-type quinol oxidase subunit 2
VLIAIEIVILAVHLACMNIASGAPLLALWLEWKDRRGDAVAPQAARYLGTVAILALLLGSLLGVLLGWLRWTPDYQAIWQLQLSRKLKWGLVELAVSGALLVAYWVWRKFAILPTRRGYLGRSLLLFLTSTNLLYHFPPILIVASKLADRGFTAEAHVPAGVIVPEDFRRLMAYDEIPALTVHFALASLAMAGIMLLGLALRWLRSDEDPRGAKRIIAWGGWSALIATGLQLLVGLWLLATTPADMQAQLTGAAWLPTICLVTSLILVVWLLRELADLTLGEPTRGGLIRTMIAMTSVILLMTAARQLSRPQVARSVSKGELISTQAAHSPLLTRRATSPDR